MESTDTDLLRLHHLALGARDVGGLAEFYRELLGLREVARYEDAGDGSLRSVWLDLGGGAILMIERSAVAAGELVEGVGSGLFLLALSAAGAGMTRCQEALAERGIRVESRTEFTCYYRDPEGNRFALSRYPTPIG